MQKWSIHHIFAQDKRRQYNIHIKENRTTIERDKHNALHMFFGNDKPREQLLTLLKLNESVIDPETRAALKEILEIPEE